MQPFILSSLMVPPDVKLGFPGIAVVKKQGEICKRGGFDSWVGMIPWCRKWQPGPVFLPGKFHEQRSLAGYSPWGCKEWDATEQREVQFSSVQFSCLVVSHCLRPHESQRARPPCPSPTPRVHPNSCASSWWCHPAISSSVVPFSSCPQSLPASGSFPVSQVFAWGGQSIGISASGM